MKRKEFGTLVKRAQSGDARAALKLRDHADDPRMRRDAVARRTLGERSAPRRPRRTAGSLTLSPEGHLDRTAILEVMESLGIKNPVMIRWADAEELGKPAPGFRRNGTHRLERDGSHTIKIRRGLTVDKARRVLVHELAHAAQSELMGRDWRRAYDAEPHKWEANARGIAQALF